MLHRKKIIYKNKMKIIISNTKIIFIIHQFENKSIIFRQQSKNNFILKIYYILI